MKVDICRAAVAIAETQAWMSGNSRDIQEMPPEIA